MKKSVIRFCFLFVIALGVFGTATAQKKKPAPRASSKRASTTKNSKTKTKANIKASTAAVDTVAKATPPPPPPANDSLPIKKVLPSLRPDEAVDGNSLRDRTPLPYENLRADDALYRHKIWREIDAREKINLPFRYSADENNGNQRFISILLQAIQDSAVTVFANVDDRFTTPMTKSEVAAIVAGPEVAIKQFDSTGAEIGVIYKRNEVNLDSFYKFRIKEEVIFDKESSRLFWRILGIAPLRRIITASGADLGESEMFWVYYPDMRPIFAKYDTYNGKNFGARMSWEELFESRMFYGRIVKSTLDNPYDQYIRNYGGLKNSTMLQLYEGENIKEKIFNYEQDLWSY